MCMSSTNKQGEKKLIDLWIEEIKSLVDLYQQKITTLKQVEVASQSLNVTNSKIMVKVEPSQIEYLA